MLFQLVAAEQARCSVSSSNWPRPQAAPNVSPHPHAQRPLTALPEVHNSHLVLLIIRRASARVHGHG